MGEKEKVILDMDPGIDDAWALILALRSEELEIKAISTVFGNTDVISCTQNVIRVLRLFQMEDKIPVHMGEKAPLEGKPLFAHDTHGKDGLGELDEILFPKPKELPNTIKACELFLKLAKEFPGEISLVCTGPLTNLAKTIRKNKEGIRMLKEVVFMGGAIHVPGNITPSAEFNIYSDPLAAQVVFQSGLKLTMIGLDVTTKTALSRKRLLKELGKEKGKIREFLYRTLNYYADFEKKIGNFDGCYFHDPLALAYLIDETVVEKEKMRVEVETKGEITSGKTVADLRTWKIKENPTMAIATKLYREKFFSLLIPRVFNLSV